MIDRHRLKLASEVSKVVDAGRRLVERMLDEAATCPTTEHSNSFEQCVSDFAALAKSVASSLDGWSDEPEAESRFVVNATGTASTGTLLDSIDHARARDRAIQADAPERPRVQAG